MERVFKEESFGITDNNKMNACKNILTPYHIIIYFSVKIKVLKQLLIDLINYKVLMEKAIVKTSKPFDRYRIRNTS